LTLPVTTTAGTGSEVTKVTVITDTDRNLKILLPTLLVSDQPEKGLTIDQIQVGSAMTAFLGPYFSVSARPERRAITSVNHPSPYGKRLYRPCAPENEEVGIYCLTGLGKSL